MQKHVPHTKQYEGRLATMLQATLLALEARHEQSI